MKRFIYFSYLFLALTLLVQEVKGQEVTSDISERLRNYSGSSIIEKLFIHTDKDYYMSGELLWMKIYAVDGATNRPLKLSTICYVELLDTANKPVLQAKIAMNDAAGNGSFYIPQSINSGNYKLRAYSRWMKNFDENGFFEKSVAILNVNKLPAASSAEPAYQPSVTVNFFPEGGNLLSQVDNRVAFKLSGSSALNQHFTGYLVSGTDTILKFSPVHKGTGMFNFTPLAGENYTVVMVPSSGRPFTVSLPPIYEEGAVMQVTDDDKYFNVQLRSKGNDKLYILVHSRGVPQVSRDIVVQNGKGDFAIEKALLPDGVSSITVFNHQAIPLCERVVFKHPSRLMDIKIESDQPSYTTRKKVSVAIAANSGLASKDSASISMAVFKLDSLQQLPELNILSYLLLASELKGPLADPQHYLYADNGRSNEALNLLLLTQGWRRFNWDPVLSRQKPSYKFVPELQGHIITGKVVNKNTGAGVPGITAFIAAPSPITLFKTALSNTDGHIKVDISNFYGSNYLVVQGQNAGNVAFTVDDPFSRNYTISRLPVFVNPTRYPKTVLHQNIGMQVQNMYTSDQMQQLMLPAFADSSAFYKKADYSYELEKYTRFTSMEEVMREFVSIVDVRIKNKAVNFHVINAHRKEYFPNAPLNLLDGVPVFNFARFFGFDPLKVYGLQVVAQQYVLGNSQFDGILNWKTYKPNLENYDFDENTLVMNYEALQLHREFYAPVYETDEQFKSHLPDFRNLLQWKPDILLKGGIPFQSSFYTSDLPGRYVIVVQGISSAGIPGTSVAYLEVR